MHQALSEYLNSFHLSRSCAFEMGFNNNVLFGRRLSYLLSISFCFLIISTSTEMGLIVEVEGRSLLFQGSSSSQIIREDGTILVVQIGSRPPICERRCSSCPRCEAIQVPTNPQVQLGDNSSSLFSKIAYTRGDGYSNYKPLSWKCKCGNVIFNP